MYMVLNAGDTDSKGAIQPFKQHPIKCNNISQSGCNRDLYRICTEARSLERSKKGRRSQALKSRLEGTKGRGQGRSFWTMAKHKTNKLSKGKCTKGFSDLNLRLKINVDP